MEEEKALSSGEAAFCADPDQDKEMLLTKEEDNKEVKRELVKSPLCCKDTVPFKSKLTVCF